MSVIDGVATADELAETERRYATFLASIAAATGVTGDPTALAAEMPGRLVRAFVGLPASDEDVALAASVEARAKPRSKSVPKTSVAARRVKRPPLGGEGLSRADRAALLAWLAVSRTGALAPGAPVAATSLAWYDELQIPAGLVSGLHDTGFDEGEAWTIADHVRLLLALPRPSTLGGPSRTLATRLVEAWLGHDAVRVAIGVNTWEDIEYVDHDRLQALLAWAVRLDRIDAGSGASVEAASSARVAAKVLSTAKTAGYRVDRLRAALSGR